MILELTFPRMDPVAIRVGPLAVHWYALSYLAAFIVGYLLMRRRLRMEPYRSITKPKAWDKADVEDMLLFTIVGVLLGGRLGYVLFYRFDQYLSNPVSILYIWQGGMSFHGGLIGVILGLLIFAWRRKRPFLQITDLLVPAVGVGLFFGRLGNFVNGELWGRQAPESLPWAMRFPTGGDVLRHPSQLYQALLEGLILFLLIWWYASKPRFRGQVSGAFVLGYGVFRFIAEYFREPDDFLGLLSLGLSLGQWLCIPMIISGAALWIWARKRALLDVEEPAEPTEADDADGLPPAEQSSGETAESTRPGHQGGAVVPAPDHGGAQRDEPAEGGLPPGQSIFAPPRGEKSSRTGSDEPKPRRAADPD